MASYYPPGRVIDDLGAPFESFIAQPTAALRDAVAKREERIEVVYRVPPEARAAARELGALLDEADAFCPAGEHLLTLATYPGPLAYRRWFLSEFVAQIDGQPPTPWD